jgi:sec-independent protein translocase protein TatC
VSSLLRPSPTPRADGARARGGKRRDVRDERPLRDHLVELRRRLTISAAAIVVAFVGAFVLTDPILAALAEPIRIIAGEKGAGTVALNFDSITSAFDLRLRISFTVGLVIAAPVWFSQLWLFLVPALTRRETRFTGGFLGAAIPLFFAGCFVGWLIAPHAITLMASFVPDGAAQFFQSAYYYDFILKLVIVVGVAFVMPVLLVLLNVAGVVSAVGIIRGWRTAAIVATLFAALATPSADVVSMLLLAAILILLFLAAAGVAFLFDRRRARNGAALVAQTP